MNRRSERRQAEPVFVAEYPTREAADAAWGSLVDNGVASVVIVDDPPWGAPRYRLQCARRDAATAAAALQPSDPQ